MTLVAPTARDVAGPTRFRLPLQSPVMAAAVMLPLAVLLCWPRLVAVWQFGTFFDTDDAMRAVEVRDWLAGQGWFDLTNYRVGPPTGLLTHWSRVVDVPLAALDLGFGLVLPPDLAERAARIAFPLALQAAMFVATAWVARILVGPRAIWPAAVLLLLSGFTYAQFQPGRIDHHAPQILLVTLMIGTTVSALDPARAGRARLTGALVAVSLAIGLETLPFVAVILGVLPLAWVARGDRQRRSLVMLAAGLAVAMPIMFVLTVPPARYVTPVYLSLSLAHLVGIGVGTLGLVALAAASPRLRTVPLRLVAAALVGAAVLGVMHACFPGSLQDPYDAMDPFVTRIWLAHVNEAQPLWSAIRLWPDTMAMVVGPILAGMMAVAVACALTRGVARDRWIAVAALLAIGFAGMMWELRVAFQMQTIAVLGGAFALTRLLDLARARKSAVAAMLPAGAALGLTAMGWALLPVGSMSDEARASQEGSSLTRNPRALAPLATLEPGLAFAPIDAGPHLLAHTRLSVLGAPYLNERNNLVVLHGFMSPPDASRPIVEGSGARTLILCPAGAQARVMAQEAPDGLAADLIAGRVPSWLKPLRFPGVPCGVYGVD